MHPFKSNLGFIVDGKCRTKVRGDRYSPRFQLFVKFPNVSEQL
jgi:hypothetical protein